MLRRLLAAAAVVCATATVAAAAPRLFHDLTGKWNVSINMGGDTRPSLLTVTQKGDSISGTNESEIGTSPILGVVKGDSVFFGFKVDMGGQALVINALAAMKDKDNMSGVLDVSGMGAIPFTAVRQP